MRAIGQIDIDHLVINAGEIGEQHHAVSVAGQGEAVNADRVGHREYLGCVRKIPVVDGAYLAGIHGGDNISILSKHYERCGDNNAGWTRWTGCAHSPPSQHTGRSPMARNVLASAPSSPANMSGSLKSGWARNLFHRTTRSVTLTETGRAYYERCLPLLDQFDELEGAGAGAPVRTGRPHSHHRPDRVRRQSARPRAATVSGRAPRKCRSSCISRTTMCR